VARIEIAFCLVNDLRRRDAWRHLIGWLTRHDKYNAVNASQERYEQLERESIKDYYDTDYSTTDKRSCYMRDLFLEAARMSPDNPDPDVQNCLGLLFNMRGEFDKAIDCYRAAVNVRPNDSLLWNRLGASLANADLLEESIEAYQRSLDVSPGAIRSRYNLAISFIHLKRYNEAAKHLLQILNTQQALKVIDGKQKWIQVISPNIWKTLRTLAKFMLRPDLYPYIDRQDVVKCNENFLTPPPASIF
jgi:peroxin-5